jgi:hypothetical protein
VKPVGLWEILGTVYERVCSQSEREAGVRGSAVAP